MTSFENYYRDMSDRIFMSLIGVKIKSLITSLKNKRAEQSAVCHSLELDPNYEVRITIELMPRQSPWPINMDAMERANEKF